MRLHLLPDGRPSVQRTWAGAGQLSGMITRSAVVASIPRRGDCEVRRSCAARTSRYTWVRCYIQVHMTSVFQAATLAPCPPALADRWRPRKDPPNALTQRTHTNDQIKRRAALCRDFDGAHARGRRSDLTGVRRHKPGGRVSALRHPAVHLAPWREQLAALRESPDVVRTRTLDQSTDNRLPPW